MSKKMVIAVDAMGGDHYPEAPVVGALMALQKHPNITIKVIGDLEKIEVELRKKKVSLVFGRYKDRLALVEATQAIPMDIKNPSQVLKMRESSIFIGSEMQKNGEVAAFVSAGNTGAVMAAALGRVGRIPGILRPALAIVIPTKNGPCIALDVGANASNKFMHLVQFAVMGSIYAERVQGIDNPRVGLMSVGEEASKGNELVQATNHNLVILGNERLINFIGNVQGNDFFAGTCDVLVMDGFTGNVVLKLAESFLPILKEALKKKVRDSSIFRQAFAAISQILLKPTIASLKVDFDYQKYGGAPLLGINGVVIKAHGKSSPLAIQHAISVATQAVTNEMVSKIRDAVANIPMDLLNLKPDLK